MARLETTSFESQTAAAWAGIVASKLFFELLVAVNDSHSTFDVRFRRETATPFTHRLESSGLRRVRIALVCSFSNVQRSPENECARQESNLVYDLRKVACVPAHSENMGWLIKKPSTSPGSRTPSNGFEDRRAVHHTRKACFFRCGLAAT